MICDVDIVTVPGQAVLCLRRRGPSTEVYLTGREGAADLAGFVTEVRLPCAR